MKILAIVGSPRVDGNTNYLVDQALYEAAKLNAKTDKIMISQYNVNPCLGHKDCSDYESCLRQDDGIWILQRFGEADGIILATPVYYYDISSWLKIFIDRNYFFYRHGRKCCAKAAGFIILAGGAGIEDTLHTLDKYLNTSPFNVPDDSRFVVTGYASRPGDVRNNSKLIEEARQLGRNMVKSLKQQ